MVRARERRLHPSALTGKETGMTGTFDFGGDIVWRPSQDDIARSNLNAFMHEHGIASFDDLMRRSTKDVAWFTDAVLRFIDIRFSKPYSRVVDLDAGIPFPRWCVDGEMNIVSNCVDKWAADASYRSRLAFIWEGEEGTVRHIRYGELADAVNRCANALRRMSFGKGDVIGLYMPMTPEIVIALFAIAKIGGIILPLFSGYGESAVASRLKDADAAGLFTSDGFFRRGEVVDLKRVTDAALRNTPGVRHVIVLRRTGHEVPMQAGRDYWWHDLMSQPDIKSECEPEVLDSEDPLFILYTLSLIHISEPTRPY